MDKTVPRPAAYLLDFIGSIEAPKGYDTLYGNAQLKRGYPWKLTELSIADVLRRGPGWARKSPYGHGSSACGRYQFMAGKNHTLQGLKDELKLHGAQIFDANLQDRLGYHLLRRRGYDKWIAGQMSDDAFMLNLAKEWASFPRPDNGRSYYAGDGQNHALVSISRVRAALKEAKALKGQEPLPIPESPPLPIPLPPNDPPVPVQQPGLAQQFWAWVFRGFRRA